MFCFTKPGSDEVIDTELLSKKLENAIYRRQRQVQVFTITLEPMHEVNFASEEIKQAIPEDETALQIEPARNGNKHVAPVAP